MFLLADDAQITPESLNKLFEASGSGLPTISDVRSTPIEAGYGYLSKAFRLELTWEGAGAESAPHTLIAKLPLPARVADANASARRMYRREAMFHRVIAPDAPIRTAKAWVTEVDEDSGLATLVFEDLGAFETFEDDETISVERIERALIQLAGLHARYWQNDGLETMDWAAHPAVTGVDQVTAEHFAASWPGLVSSGAYELSPTQLRLGELLGEKLDAVYEALHAGPKTIIHADLHQENLFFDGVEPAFIDWAATERANPAKDVAKLTASCLEPGTIQQERPALIRTYWDELNRRIAQPGAAGDEGGAAISLADLERYIHLAMCHYLGMMTFLSDARDFAALAANPETRSDFTTSRVIAACDDEALLTTIEGV